MISAAGGNRPATMPLVYLDGTLTYRPDGGDESIWEGYAIVEGVTNTPVWSEVSDIVFHGTYSRLGAGSRAFGPVNRGIFWVSSATVDAESSDQILFHQPPKQAIDASNYTLENIGQMTGGMDDLLIYHPNDLFQRSAGDSSHAFGERFNLLDDSFLLTSDTGFMLSAPVGRAFILRIPYIAATGYGLNNDSGLPALLAETLP